MLHARSTQLHIQYELCFAASSTHVQGNWTGMVTTTTARIKQKKTGVKGCWGGGVFAGVGGIGTGYALSHGALLSLAAASAAVRRHCHLWWEGLDL